MKKTTWIILGLSVCVLVLGAALGVVLSQKKTEIIYVNEPDPYTSSFIYVKPWQRFSIRPFPRYSILYYNQLPLEKGTVVYYNKEGLWKTDSIKSIKITHYRVK